MVNGGLSASLHPRKNPECACDRRAASIAPGQRHGMATVVNALSRARVRGSARGFQRRKSTLEIGLEVVDVFEPDMQPQRRPARCPFGRGAILVAVERDREALVAAPGKS